MRVQKVLIANRSEIAVRIINTCRLMDIATVVVFAEDDRESLPVTMADEAQSLGRGTLAETYLNQKRIVELAQRTGADAIHPGYGFLSERAEFCRLCQENGLIFIGPSPEVIDLMGDKQRSKQAMEKIGVPLIPGYHEAGESDGDELLRQAKALGTPLLIKAIAGGGGKGMALVEKLADFNRQWQRACREAQNAFGDGRVLLEKWLDNPRHIEVQVLSDGHGQHFHFWERECSIQRRHQKIIEETPSPALDQKLRRQICQTAVGICQEINYLGVGTVEFLLEQTGAFYFLEMNTRLQVEHPITEMVTGHDLVELQIRVARGEKLPLRQADIVPNGHALEVRVYAENPAQDFLPTTGILGPIGHSRLAATRLECGYDEGAVIGIHYDPLLAKVCSHSHSRSHNLVKMGHLLDDYCFLGLTTNRNYLQAILAHGEFQRGGAGTGFVEAYGPELLKKSLPRRGWAEVAAAYTLFLREENAQGVAADGEPSPQPSLFMELGTGRES